MMGAPKGSTKRVSGKAGNQTCNLGLQGIALIQYTMAALSLFKFINVPQLSDNSDFFSYAIIIGLTVHWEPYDHLFC